MEIKIGEAYSLRSGNIVRVTKVVEGDGLLYYFEYIVVKDEDRMEKHAENMYTEASNFRAHIPVYSTELFKALNNA